MAGTTSVAYSIGNAGITSSQRFNKVVVSFIADAADGSIPDTSLTNLAGYIMKIVTNPGATAPTDNWDFVLNDSDGVDVLGGAGANRDTANSEQVYPTISGATIPVWLEKGTYTLAMSGNSVNSATGTVTLYLKDTL
jgi:hypothetical protein